jgi:peptidoglycan/xylan/chitin deacetylase (PgdA/CDA1 family)
VKIRFYRPVFPAPVIYREALFRVPVTERILYLTFDDGPDPGSTPALLEILGEMNVKATFFCSGRAAEKYQSLVSEILMQGHITGNHGYDHLNGWITGLREYCANAFKAVPFTSDKFFRPPYGKILPCQYERLRRAFSIVFWDLMVFDFDSGFSPEKSLDLLRKKKRPGSVIVLHDTPDSSCRQFLKEFIQESVEEGYSFDLPAV